MTAFAFILGVCAPGGVHGRRRQLAPDPGHDGGRGMLAATFIAIFIIPVTFYVSERFSRRRGKAEEQPADVVAVGTGGRPGRITRATGAPVTAPVKAERPRRRTTHRSARMKKARQWLFTIVASAGLLAGCAVGPDYKRPTTTPPERSGANGPRGSRVPRRPALVGGLPGSDAPGAAADGAGQQLRPAGGRRPRGGGARLGGQGQGRVLSLDRV